MRPFMLSTLLATALAVVLAAAAIGIPPREIARARETSLTLLARGPAGIRIEGRSSSIGAAVGSDQLVFSLPLASIDTEIDLRNQHLREMLEVDRFPFASLEIARAGVVFPASDKPTEGVAQGKLTLHGISRPIMVDYRAERSADRRIRLHGSLLVDLREYGVQPPAYLGMSVSPEVGITGDLSLEGG